MNETPESNSQADERLNGIYGTIIFDEINSTETELHQRNVTIYADGRVDRSPCGSGTAARIAQLAHSGKLTKSMTLIHDSIIGTRFLGQIEETQSHGQSSGVIPVITGNAFQVANSEFLLFENDELDAGFSLR